jgi:hypothetical protein
VSSNRNAAYSQQSPTLEAYPKETLNLKSTRFGVKVSIERPVTPLHASFLGLYLRYFELPATESSEDDGCGRAEA